VSTFNANIVSDSIGRAWLAIARLILEQGRSGHYDGLSIREVLLASVRIEHPCSNDPLIAHYADPERLAWMHANFTDHARVAALGDADSYATRLYDYARSGRNQLAWVTRRLREDPTCRSATITTFQPLTDTTYVPCVSLLDFYLEDDQLNLVASCHSIDFGAKGYGNLVELAFLAECVAKELHVGVGALTMVIKSAHVYDTDTNYLEHVLDNAPQTGQ